MANFTIVGIKDPDVGPADFQAYHFVAKVSVGIVEDERLLSFIFGQLERHLLRQPVVAGPLKSGQQADALPLFVIS